MTINNFFNVEIAFKVLRVSENEYLYSSEKILEEYSLSS